MLPKVADSVNWGQKFNTERNDLRGDPSQIVYGGIIFYAIILHFRSEFGSIY